MSVKPDTPITRKEMYLDAATGGSSTLPEPETIEEKFLAKIAGMTVDLPAPVPLKHKFLAKIAGMQVDVPTYTAGLPRIYAYLAKAAGQDVEVPQPITREEMYWFDYVSGQPTPSEQEYTGAVPVTFIANGKSLLDYLISGNSVQNGTPTPQSPIIPQGTGERTGNLLDYTTVESTTNATATQISGGISVSGRYYVRFRTVEFTVGSTYTMSWKANTIGGTSAPSWRFHYADNTYSSMPSSGGSLVVEKEVSELLLYVSTSANCVVEFTEIMLNTGSTALPYEPFGVKIPISSASTTTPVYLGEVQTTRKIKKVDLGTLTWSKTQSGNFWADTAMDDMKIVSNIQKNNALCDIFKEVVPEHVTATPYSFSSCLNNRQRPFINSTGFENMSAAEFKEAMSGVYMYYVLTTEETAVVNEPLMKIGDYADTVSMEQAGVQIPTASGSNTLDVLTEVKPSEVYIKYKGEPVSQLSMLSSPGTDEPEEAPEELSEEAEEMPEEEEEEVPEETEITPETEE